MSEKVVVRSKGIGFVGLLTIAFVVLKLTGYIDWSWWWILAPLWISTLFWIALITLVVWLNNR
jgi:hypothetical protein